MINSSINQTLSRTLLTSLTTLIVVLLLYLFGGEGIHAFAFALVIGVICRYLQFDLHCQPDPAVVDPARRSSQNGLVVSRYDWLPSPSTRTERRTRKSIVLGEAALSATRDVCLLRAGVMNPLSSFPPNPSPAGSVVLDETPCDTLRSLRNRARFG